MPYQAILHYDLPIWDETASGRSLTEVRQGHLENPYSDYLELLRYLFALATDSPPDSLERFADCGSLRIEDPGNPWARYTLMLLQMTPGSEKPGWYDFAPEAFSELLKQDLLAPCFDGEAYRNLDYYLTALAELRLLREKPQAQAMIQRLWIYDELLDFYWATFPLRKILAAAYLLLGWRWFCLDAETYPLHYRGGLLAALALLDAQPESASRVHKDLVALHDQLILTAGARLAEPLLAELREAIQAAIQKLSDAR
jgi:hypothetical protein